MPNPATSPRYRPKGARAMQVRPWKVSHRECCSGSVEALDEGSFDRRTDEKRTHSGDVMEPSSSTVVVRGEQSAQMICCQIVWMYRSRLAPRAVFNEAAVAVLSGYHRCRSMVVACQGHGKTRLIVLLHRSATPLVLPCARPCHAILPYCMVSIRAATPDDQSEPFDVSRAIHATGLEAAAGRHLERDCRVTDSLTSES